MRKALIETATGKVVNIILIEDGANWRPPDGHEVRDAESCGPGWTWDGAKFNRPDKAASLTQEQIDFAAATALGKVEIIAMKLGLK